MNKERKVTGYGDAVTIWEENGKCYILKDYGEGVSRGAKKTYTYAEIDKDEYLGRVRTLAQKIGACPSVKVTDILEDALRTYTLAELERIEQEISGEVSKAERESRKPEVRTKQGRCCEINIGRKCCFVVRD